MPPRVLGRLSTGMLSPCRLRWIFSAPPRPPPGGLSSRCRSAPRRTVPGIARHLWSRVLWVTVARTLIRQYRLAARLPG